MTDFSSQEMNVPSEKQGLIYTCSNAGLAYVSPLPSWKPILVLTDAALERLDSV